MKAASGGGTAAGDEHLPGATALGFMAILFWTTTMAASRHVTASVGPLTASAIVHAAGGVLGFLVVAARRELGSLRRISLRFAFVCGSMFITYHTCLFLAMATSRSDAQAVEVAILNYLWPGLTLVLSVPLLGRRARWSLLPGLCIAFAGVAVANGGRAELSLGGVAQNLRENPTPYLFALGCAVSWPLYSNLNRRWRTETGAAAVPLFLVAVGAVLAALLPFFPEKNAWGGSVWLELGYLALFPTFFSLTFWDIGMRLGNQTLLVASSYFIPILSTIASCLWLGVPAGRHLILASVLVSLGAYVCKRSMRERAPSPVAASPGRGA